jgi:DNA-binding NarL/FixJ family response regulator
MLQMETGSETNQSRRVVIVDDHAMIAELLRQIFESVGGYVVTGHAKNSAEALQLCRQAQPDLIMLDLVLPDCSGLSLLRQIRTLCPASRVVVFSGNLSGPIIRSALMAGVTGIIGKGAELDEFKSAIRTVGAGRTFLCAQTSETVRLMVHTTLVTSDKPAALSQREQTVLRHIASGLSSREIAAKLGLSCYTVSNFRSKLSKKTGLHRTAQLSRYAAEIGLIDGPLEPRQQDRAAG